MIAATTTAFRRAVCVSATARCNPSKGIISTASSWSFSSNGTKIDDRTFPHRSFSSAPQLRGNAEEEEEEEEKRVLVMPPNLKIDPRCVSSPFYGLEKVKDIKKHSVSEESETATATADGAMSSIEEEDEYEIDYDDDADGTSYDLTNAIQPVYAVPLPERLHVPIVQFVPPSSPESESPPEEIGTIHLSSDVFGQDPIRTDILHRCVVYQRNKKRGLRNNGARTKTISEVSGSGRKVRPQKGGGTARAGHSRPPHWRGGAKAHGPKGSVQNYETKLNKKVRRSAVKMALSQKLKEGNLILVDGFGGMETYKTKVLAKALERVGDIGGRYGCTAYLVDHTVDDDPEEDSEEGVVTSVGGIHVNLRVASKNLFKIKVTNQRFVNVYDVLKYDKMVMSLSAFQAIEERMCDNY